MFGKLLKYDFRSMLKQFAFIWPAALVLAAVNRYTVTGLDSTSVTGETVAGVAMLVFVAIMIAMFVIAVIFVVQRFHKGLLGDEGYLMHTLPVRPWQMILSKLVCAVVLTVVSIAVAIVSILVIVSPVVEFREVIKGLRWFWDSVTSSSHAVNSVFAMIEFFLLFVVGMAQGYLMLYLAMAVGHLFNKNRVAMSVAAYIGIQVIVSTLFGTIAKVFNEPFDSALESFFQVSAGWRYFHQSLWFTIIATGAVGAVYFFLTEYILRNKLNLE